MKKNYKEKENIIDGALKLLAERYPIGLYEFLFKYEPEMYKILHVDLLMIKLNHSYSIKLVLNLLLNFTDL